MLKRTSVNVFLAQAPTLRSLTFRLSQLTPLAIDTSMQVYEELHTQAEAAQRLRARTR